MRIIPTGVDLTAINENPRRDVRKELGIDSNEKVILTPVSYTHLDVYKRQI